MLRIFVSFAVLALLCACTSSSSAPSVPARTVLSPQKVTSASGSCCNIFWNKKRLDLRGSARQRAELTYWAPNSYYLTPVDCKNGGKISVTPGTSWGDPSGYMHVKYWFQAQSPGPDRCGITAVLNGTGSPPLAVLKLHIR